jgi:hypothetical protein
MQKREEPRHRGETVANRTSGGCSSILGDHPGAKAIQVDDESRNTCSGDEAFEKWLPERARLLLSAEGMAPLC